MINDQAKLPSFQGTSTARSAAEQQSCSTSKFMNIVDKKLFGETSLAIQKSDKFLNIFNYIEVVNFKIDTFMLDKFWQCIAENRCVAIHASILDWLGYESKNERDNKASFIQLLHSHNIQFQQIKHTDPNFKNYPDIVQDSKTLNPNALNRKLWIIMDSDDFKEMVMCLQTKKAHLIRKYYLSLEKLVKMYSEYTHHFQMVQVKEQLQEAEERALNFQQLAISDIHLEQNQVIYIATSPNYARQNRFKVGGVKARRCLKGRLGVYNTRSAQGDFFYYSDIFMVFEYRQIEERLKSLLRRFRDKDPKEMYIMYYPDIKYIVKYICDHLAEEVEEVNRKLSEFIFNYVKRGRNAIVPQEIEDWKNEEQDDVENEEEDVEAIATDLENLRVALIELLNKLPATTTEITKKELFDKLKVRKGRIEKLDQVKQVIAEQNALWASGGFAARPSLILRERKDRVVKKEIKYPK